MNLLISDNTRCVAAPDGTTWSPDTTRGYDAWKEYLDTFDEVRVLVRAQHSDRPPRGWAPMCGPGVRGVPVPYFIGPWQLAPRYWIVRNAIKRALRQSDALCLRLPATLSQVVWGCMKRGRPYGVHVTGDPFEALAPGLNRDPSRGIFRWLYSKRLLCQTGRACAVAYVTSDSLQQKYPPPPGIFTSHFSNVLLPGAAFVATPRAPLEHRDPFHVITVAGMANLIKRLDVFIDSIGICVQAGVPVWATIVGDGKHRLQMEARCRALGLETRVTFTGQLSSADEVRNRLDQAHLFILSSQTEGLPRAMLEAMARGLPCIGTAVGGIPEILPPACLFPPGDTRALAQKIAELSANPARLARMSADCLHTAQRFSVSEVAKRRAGFCYELRSATAEWIRRAGPSDGR